MKIGTLLTAAIVSLSTVGGGLAAYVAVTKYQTMERVSVAQSRLEVVRAVGEIPRYMNPERGFATNILYGPATVEPKMRTDLVDKYRVDLARCRRSQRQPAQEPCRIQARGDRGRKAGSEPLPGPQRSDPDVAAATARQSRDAGQCGGGAGQDERRLC